MTVSSPTSVSFLNSSLSYLERLHSCFNKANLAAVEILVNQLHQAWVDGRNVFICGNGGSAANAIHIANDLHYGIGACGSGKQQPGLRIEALSANSSVITCLANDTGYENIYSNQLQVKADQNDLLIVLSGSGNSPNVVNALKYARDKGIYSYAIVAFDGGKCKEIANETIHINVRDMQIAEDSQLIIGHICMQWLNANKPNTLD